jgi:hypothetical protein
MLIGTSTAGTVKKLIIKASGAMELSTAAVAESLLLDGLTFSLT